MVRIGEVMAKEGDQLTVVFERPAACSTCQGCLTQNCTSVQLTGEAEVGDSVEVALPDAKVIKASAMAYAVPLLALLAGLLLGEPLHNLLNMSMNKDLFAAVCGGVSLCIGLLVIHQIDKRMREKKTWQPRIVAVHKAVQK